MSRNDRGGVGSSQDNLHLNVNCGALQSTASGSSGQGEPMEDKVVSLKFKVCLTCFSSFFILLFLMTDLCYKK